MFAPRTCALVPEGQACPAKVLRTCAFAPEAQADRTAAVAHSTQMTAARAGASRFEWTDRINCAFAPENAALSACVFALEQMVP
jgi:hypothetical protein